MPKLKNKSEFFLWFIHMIISVWFSVVFWIFMAFILVVLEMVTHHIDIIHFILNFIQLWVVWFFVYKTALFIRKNFKYNYPYKLALFSTFYFLLLNLWFIWLILFTGHVEWSMNDKFIHFTWLNDIYSMILYWVFYILYFFLTIVWLEKK